MIPDALDGIEVGDVEHGRAGDGEEGAGEADRIVGGSQRRLDRPVLVARPTACMHDGPVFQVEGRNDGEIVHGTYLPQILTTPSCPALCRASTSFLSRGWPGQARP